MMRKIFVLLGSVALIAAFIFISTVISATAPQPERREPVSLAPTVFVQEATFGPVALSVYAQGEVTPKQEITLTAQVGGTIVSVSDSFALGGVIAEGDILLRIEDADYQLALTRAQARVATARQALAIEEAESELAQRDFEDLSAGSSSPTDPSALTLRQPQLARAQADYQAALADQRDAELALSRTRVRAPFNGRIRSINANLGQFISPGSQLGQLFSTDTAQIRLPLTDQDLARLQLPFAFGGGDDAPEVILTATAAGVERRWVGHIARVDAALDPTTRQIGAIVEVDDPYGDGADNGFPLAVGLYVDAQIAGPTLERATIVPVTAVRENKFVYTLDPSNFVVENEVTVIASTSEGIVITDGLAEGDRVIVSRVTVPVGTEVRPLDPNNPVAPDEPTNEETADDEASDDASVGASISVGASE